MRFPRADISPNHIFFIYLNLFYRWYTKVAEANEFQQKSINTNNKLNAGVKLTYLQIKHPQSIFLRFLTLVLYSKTELMDLFRQEVCPARRCPIFLVKLFQNTLMKGHYQTVIMRANFSFF